MMRIEKTGIFGAKVKLKTLSPYQKATFFVRDNKPHSSFIIATIYITSSQTTGFSSLLPSIALDITAILSTFASRKTLIVSVNSIKRNTFDCTQNCLYCSGFICTDNAFSSGQGLAYPTA